MSVVENKHNLRELLKVMRDRRTSMFLLRTLLKRHQFLTPRCVSHLMPHLVNAGLVEEYSYTLNKTNNNSKRNVTYRRCFDKSIDIDKCMKEMIKNEVQIQGNRVSHLR